MGWGWGGVGGGSVVESAHGCVLEVSAIRSPLAKGNVLPELMVAGSSYFDLLILKRSYPGSGTPHRRETVKGPEAGHQVDLEGTKNLACRTKPTRRHVGWPQYTHAEMGK